MPKRKSTPFKITKKQTREICEDCFPRQRVEALLNLQLILSEAVRKCRSGTCFATAVGGSGQEAKKED